MPKNTKKSRVPTTESARIIWRDQGGQKRAYAELRDLGLGRIALKPKGEKRATTDPEIADHLLRELLNNLAEARKNEILLGIDPDADLAEFSIYHLEKKTRSGEYSERWLTISETYLARAVAFFTRYQHATEEIPEPKPRPRNLAAISVLDVHAFMEWLKTQSNGRGSMLGRQSRRHHLSVLSGVFKRAISEGKLPLGSNPVSGLLDKPRAPKSKTKLLEVDELALLLESARTVNAYAAQKGGGQPLPCAYELVAAFILTGARENELRRLDVRHVDFRSDSIEILGTKTEPSDRTTPIHRQLRDILLPYIKGLGRRDGPVFTGADGRPFGDWRKTLDLIAVRAGFRIGEIRTRVFRTSYITHRLACIDHGAPIDPYQVAREVGHSSLAMIMKVYGRVQRRRVRMEELAFEVESIGPDLEDRLRSLSEPPSPAEHPGAKESAELAQRFLTATDGMSTAAAAAASKLPLATMKRLRGKKPTVLQGKTKERIKQFLASL